MGWEEEGEEGVSQGGGGLRICAFAYWGICYGDGYV